MKKNCSIICWWFSFPTFPTATLTSMQALWTRPSSWTTSRTNLRCQTSRWWRIWVWKSVRGLICWWWETRAPGKHRYCESLTASGKHTVVRQIDWIWFVAVLLTSSGSKNNAWHIVVLQRFLNVWISKISTKSRFINFPLCCRFCSNDLMFRAQRNALPATETLHDWRHSARTGQCFHPTYHIIKNTDSSRQILCSFFTPTGDLPTEGYLPCIRYIMTKTFTVKLCKMQKKTQIIRFSAKSTKTRDAASRYSELHIIFFFFSGSVDDERIIQFLELAGVVSSVCSKLPFLSDWVFL